jgi:hypothetical protein
MSHHLTWSQRFQRMMHEAGFTFDELKHVSGFDIEAAVQSEPYPDWLQLAIYVHEAGRHYDEHDFEDSRPRPNDEERVLIKKWNNPDWLEAIYVESEDLFMINVSQKEPDGNEQIFGSHIEQWKYGH